MIFKVLSRFIAAAISILLGLWKKVHDDNDYYKALGPGISTVGASPR